MHNIADQIALEREQIGTGLYLLDRNTRQLEEKAYASASVYGSSCVRAMLAPLSAKISETTDRLHERKAGLAFADIHRFVECISADEAAAITIKIAFDKVFGLKEKCNTAVNVCKSIGWGIESECQIRYYEQEMPDLYRFIATNYWHDCSGTVQKVSSMRTIMNRKGIKPWENWTEPVRARLGAWLMDCLEAVSGWFMKELISYSRTQRELLIVPTPELLAIKKQLLDDARLFSPVQWPMLIPPKDWSNEERGGYILDEVMCANEMVRRGNSALIQGEAPIAALNRAQRTEFTVNNYMLEVAEELYAIRRSVGTKFRPPASEPIPPKPFDIDTNDEARKGYRRARAQVENRNKAVFRKSCRTRMTMEAAIRFRDVERFYLPFSMDYRGRIYPIPPFLTPQDTDFGKSLIRFNQESFITPDGEDWLAFQVATCYGLDKAPINERLEWTRANHTLIKQIADNPIGMLPEWEVAEEPFQFLAACEEYTAVIIDCTRHTTGLMVATDATCSGLQILAGLAKDATTARLVNVLPSDRPQDAYKAIAEVAKPKCPEALRQFMDRKITKKTVMTLPYNSKPWSNRSYVRQAFKDKDLRIDKDDLTLVVDAIRAAMHEVVEGPMEVMDWIEKEVGKAFKRGATHLTWTTPSGFVVYQKLHKCTWQNIRMKLFGETSMRVANGEKPLPDVRHHKNATSPNLIHSLDASLLHLSVLKFDAPIALIHDSVLCRATDMSNLSSVVREVYMEMFTEHDVLQDFADAIGAEGDLPIIGDLKPESVINSTYFFC